MSAVTATRKQMHLRLYLPETGVPWAFPTGLCVATVLLRDQTPLFSAPTYFFLLAQSARHLPSLPSHCEYPMEKKRGWLTPGRPHGLRSF